MTAHFLLKIAHKLHFLKECYHGMLSDYTGIYPNISLEPVDFFHRALWQLHIMHMAKGKKFTGESKLLNLEKTAMFMFKI